MKKLLVAIICALLIIHTSARAEEAKAPCAGSDKTCLLQALTETTAAIDNADWRDQTYRELAKLLSRQKRGLEAADLIAKINSPDTKAMTIRGIGMAAAKTDMTKPELDALFARLRQEAEKIDHPPSYAIALTYIAMSQAFAKDDDGAMKTALEMKNSDLRNKALGEAAKIQADRGALGEALKSIAAIDSPAYRNKAHYMITKIFADAGHYDEALSAADKIDTAYQKSQALLYILAKQISPEELSVTNDPL
jgi:hypothetical protein